MHFAPDSEETLEFAVQLANTDPSASRSGRDELDSPAVLLGILDRVGYSGRRDGDQHELEDVLRTRSRVRRIWTLDLDDAVAEVNSMLHDARALPHLARHDGSPWHLHATEPDAPLAERIRVEIALAIVDLIRSGEMHRMRVCEAEGCEGLLVDLSRNGSKRFCSVRCGNRMNQLAFRERRVG